MRQRLHVLFGERSRRRAHYRHVALAIAVFVQRLQEILIRLAGEIGRARNARVTILAMAGRAQAKPRGWSLGLGRSLCERERRGRKQQED